MQSGINTWIVLRDTITYVLKQSKDKKRSCFSFYFTFSLSLPFPSHSHFLLSHNQVPLRVWRVYEEWHAAELGLGSTVCFYRNKINGNCMWVQPEEWKKEDERLILEARQKRERGFTDTENKAALTLQSIYRGKVMREDFQSLLKAVKIMKHCEAKYLRDPNNLRALCNYMLYVLTIQQDYDRARPLIAEAMKRMVEIGPDVAFILYTSYAIYISLREQ